MRNRRRCSRIGLGVETNDITESRAPGVGAARRQRRSDRVAVPQAVTATLTVRGSSLAHLPGAGSVVRRYARSSSDARNGVVGPREIGHVVCETR